MPTITARVRVVLDIKTSGRWGNACTIEQAKKQSMDAANIVLSQIKNGHTKSVEIIGKPEFLTITMHGENND